jgi:inner membrane protein
MIQDVISDRESRRDSVIGEISQKWGQKQTIVGPVVTIPYKYRLTDSNTSESIISYAHFLPETLTVNGSMAPELRYRGIYEAVLYNSRLSLSGSFSPLTPGSLGIQPEDVMFDKAFVSIGISDMTGIKESIEMTWNEDTYVAEPGIESTDVVSSGITISPIIETGEAYSFSFDLNLNGSTGLLFSPVGEETSVQIESNWSNPSFAGGFLPSQREVDADGFRSEWNVLHLNRNFPQQWKGANKEVASTTFGVDLLLPVDEYQKTMRTAKYAIMFIGLTFLTFFMIELLSVNSIHPVQYLLIGFALLIFYTLLLSISEYVVFGLAYLIASVAIISLITIYSYTVLSDSSKTGVVFGILSLLYGYLYILLQLQDVALLMGSIGLFLVLACVMYLTRNIDWFEIMASSDQPQSAPLIKEDV